ncbi:hypothetical protein IE53DRAFT_390497 [Violaceomyces palustris]|uniref:Uncharacterized protein n=1 Tax=Violaceomyces palustris TaxID=1673888 RepID=A0ACD0NNL4_9BASI|nr:hypothetical protein IE53DRAFT_390497 [Violaceomyces palustris]
MTFQLYPISALLGVVLALHGLRKGSLSESGAISAAILGYSCLGNPSSTFGLLLLAFYFTGSRATKVKADVKAKLEREVEQLSDKDVSQTGHKAQSGGKRDVWQVLCNGLTASIAAILFRALYGGEVDPSTIPSPYHLLTETDWDQGSSWCSLDPSSGRGAPRFLILIALGHFSCCMGDTLASELGILSKSVPRLIINPFRKVPPGTNGGVSLLGTLMSLLGGVFIGLVCALVTYHNNPACSRPTNLIGTSPWSWHNIVLLGALGGLLGSALDSILGATLQRTLYSSKHKQVLLGRLPARQMDVRSKGKPKVDDEDWKVVTGYDVLTNNQVNFVSSLITSLSVAWMGMKVLV